MNDIIKKLIQLGFNEYEAKVYLAIVMLSEGTAKEISEQSGVPRSRIYDVMERLAGKGFVEVGSTTPLCYKANEPSVAFDHLMGELKKAQDDILRKLTELDNKVEKLENPIWTLKGDWAIDHKIEELLRFSKKEIAFICFSNEVLRKFAKTISECSEKKSITVVTFNHPESFVGLLGKSRLMTMGMSQLNQDDMGGKISENGYLTDDGKFCIELSMMFDGENSFILTREGKSHRAIIVNGTILNAFNHQSLERIMRTAVEVRMKGKERAVTDP
jgi:predicted transcriptional regulator